MIVLDCQQGDAEWQAARMGIPTASSFHRILTPAKLAPSAQREEYMNELLGEWVLGREKDFGGTVWTDRGHALEPLARAWYAMETDHDVEEVGFVYKDKARMVGCSPDGVVKPFGRNGGVETKCPMAKTHIGYLRRGKVPTEYLLQIHGNLWVTGFDWWDFISYHPDLPPLRIRVEPEERYMNALDVALEVFVADLVEARDKLRSMGVVPHGEEREPAPLPF